MKTWITKEGEEIKISEMDDLHLLNTIRFLEKRANQGIKRVYSCGYEANNDFETGDTEIVYGQEALDSIEEYPYLLKEAKKRGLK